MAQKARNVLAEDVMDRTAQTRSDDIESRRRRPEHHEDVWVLEEILDSTAGHALGAGQGDTGQARSE